MLTQIVACRAPAAVGFGYHSCDPMEEQHSHSCSRKPSWVHGALLTALLLSALLCPCTSSLVPELPVLSFGVNQRCQQCVCLLRAALRAAAQTVLGLECWKGKECSRPAALLVLRRNTV